jgi:hypothetical protein
MMRNAMRLANHQRCIAVDGEDTIVIGAPDPKMDGSDVFGTIVIGAYFDCRHGNWWCKQWQCLRVHPFGRYYNVSIDGNNYVIGAPAQSDNNGED